MERWRVSSRYHTVQMHCYQRIDAHSWGVAMLVDYLTTDMRPRDKLMLLQAALRHDMAECEVGDVPAPAKRKLGIRKALDDAEFEVLRLYGWGTPELRPHQKRILAIADAADGALHCIAERRHGNMNVVPVFKNFMQYLVTESDCGRTQEERDIMDYIWEEWSKAHERK
jgi:5'-deoxynucleotidase YfbR-like HD superfamily hydrolase